MVFLTTNQKLFLSLISLLSFHAYSEDIPAPLIDIFHEIKSININIPDLKVNYELGEDIFDINTGATNISNELLYHKYLIGILTDENSDWNESEQMILNAKIKLQTLQKKIKFEGAWGQLRLRVIDFRDGNLGQLKLRYNYGF